MTTLPDSFGSLNLTLANSLSAAVKDKPAKANA
jgi:hypothetical protein